MAPADHGSLGAKGLQAGAAAMLLPCMDPMWMAYVCLQLMCYAYGGYMLSHPSEHPQPHHHMGQPPECQRWARWPWEAPIHPSHLSK